MRRRVKQFYWVSVMLGLILTYSAFSVPKKDQEMVKAAKSVALEVGLAVKKVCLTCTVKKEISQKIIPQDQVYQDYVYIDGKAYPKSPHNIYVINGERLFFLEGSKEPTKLEEKSQPSVQTQLVGTSKVNPFLAYTPEKVRELMQNVRQAKRQLEDRNRTLERIDQN